MLTKRFWSSSSRIFYSNSKTRAYTRSECGYHAIRRTTKPGRNAHLQFPSGVELLQAVDRVLSVHHRRHTFTVLNNENTIAIGRPRVTTTLRTQIHGTLSAWSAVIRFFGFTVNMLSMRLFASGVTVSHSGLGYWKKEQNERKLKAYWVLNSHRTRQPWSERIADVDPHPKTEDNRPVGYTGSLLNISWLSDDRRRVKGRRSL